MKPPYDITPQILKLITSISERLGEVKANFMVKPPPQLRKRNKVRTIHSSLRIEGNTLTESQITAIIENKRVIGPEKDIKEVINAIKVYEKIDQYNPFSDKSFLAAHKELMNGLIEKPGRYRTENVGIAQGTKVAHLAPPAANVHYQMADLFKYLKSSDDPILIKSCVFHYETEFIHPFFDGNGRMGRLWQTVILIKEYPVFEFIPFETLISKRQQEYYDVLGQSDRAGKSTVFIEFMLQVINDSLKELLNISTLRLSALDRIKYFIDLEPETFSRKDYLMVFKDISTATASRDLKKGIEEGLITKIGDRRNTKYQIKNQH